MNNKAIILLSGGLDSLVALGYVLKHKTYDVKMALTFDYGQKSVDAEINSSAKICKYYNVEHKIIKLDWLKEITNTSLVSDAEVPKTNLNTKESAMSVWVPNRNALFLNIAAAFCDSYEYNYIIYGANKDEAVNFPDNTQMFRDKISEMFKYSTIIKPEVVAPLINYSKGDIVKIAVEGSFPLELVMSCYDYKEGHCGKCESCKYLKNALLANNCNDLVNLLFNI